MSNIVEVILKATDQTSKTIGKVNSAFKELTGVSIGAASAVAAIGKGLQYVINEAIEAEKADAKLNQALQSTKMIAGVTKDDLDRMASSLSRVTTFSEETVKGAESLLLTFTKIGRETFPDALEAALNLSTAFGQDLQSSTIQIGKALNDPNGMAAMRRIGVSFTEAQIEMGKAMFETGDIAGYQKLILEELNTEIGGMARAMGTTYAGQVEILKNNMGELGETIGKVLVPTLSVAAKALNDLMTMNKQIADSVYETGVRVAREGKPYEYYRDSILDVLQANGKLTVAQRRIIEGFQDGSISAKAFQNDYDLLIQRTGLMTEEMFLEAAAAENLSTSIDGVTDSMELNLISADDMISITEQMAGIEEKRTAGLEDLDKKLKDGKITQQQYEDGVKSLAEETELATRRIILAYAQQLLAADGLTVEEAKLLLQKGADWGIYSQTAIDEMLKIIEEAGALTEAINNIPTAKQIRIQTIYEGAVDTSTLAGIQSASQPKQKVSNPAAQLYASGVPRLAGGGSFTVPGWAGYEGFSMGGIATASAGETVTVTPANQAANMLTKQDVEDAFRRSMAPLVAEIKTAFSILVA